jgi:MFS superfamily sulfate permease-like transporter
MVTYLSVMILDVDVGLYIGVAFSLLLVIFRSQRARSAVLGNIPGTSIYEDVNACELAKEFETIKIIRYEESIYYANVENFKYKVIKLARVNPAEIVAKIKKEKSRVVNETRKAARIAKVRKGFF